MQFKKVAISLALSSISGLASAYGCSGISSDVSDAQLFLQRAAKESNLSSAKDHMRRAQSSLDDASLSAGDCHCDTAASYFEEAGTYARRARDVDNMNEFKYRLRRTYTAYDNGIYSLNSCFQ